MPDRLRQQGNVFCVFFPDVLAVAPSDHKASDRFGKGSLLPLQLAKGAVNRLCKRT